MKLLLILSGFVTRKAVHEPHETCCRFDVDILALALETGAPLWSNDSDFEEVVRITLYKTKAVMDLVGYFKGS